MHCVGAVEAQVERGAEVEGRWPDEPSRHQARVSVGARRRRHVGRRTEILGEDGCHQGHEGGRDRAVGARASLRAQTQVWDRRVLGVLHKASRIYFRSSRAREKMSVSKLQLFLLDVLMERLACDVDICQGRLWSCYFVNCRYNHDTLSLIFVKSNDHSALFVLHCFCRRWAVTVYHPVGTCSMGVVVDSRWHSTPELLRREKKSLVWTYYSSSRFLFRIDFIQSTY